MKTKKVVKKLLVKKETISNLDFAEMNEIKGGSLTTSCSCPTPTYQECPTAAICVTHIAPCTGTTRTIIPD